jgi:thiosulfate sulfurtransferase
VDSAGKYNRHCIARGAELSMAHFERISVDTAFGMMADGTAQLVDVRDEQSYASSRIAGATHLTNTNLQDFIQEADPDLPLIVYCYHGNSSQSAAAFLNEKGFDNAYSMDGGFEQWRTRFPIEST